MNIFTSENIRKYTTSTGEIVQRNGYTAISLRPSPVWGGSDDYGNSNFKGALRGLFLPNTQYRFDIWIDTDDVFYTDGNRQVPAGFAIVFTDNTKVNLIKYGDINAPIGWQHIVYTSPIGTTIDAISVYYWIDTPAYYRYDSIIVPINKNINFIDNKGISKSSILIETPNSNTHISDANTIHANNFYEF